MIEQGVMNPAQRNAQSVVGQSDVGRQFAIGLFMFELMPHVCEICAAGTSRCAV